MRLLRCQADDVEHFLDAASREADEPLGDGQDLPASATGVLGRSIEKDAHPQTWVRRST
jgi:hypothetical protein